MSVAIPVSREELEVPEAGSSFPEPFCEGRSTAAAVYVSILQRRADRLKVRLA